MKETREQLPAVVDLSGDWEFTYTPDPDGNTAPTLPEPGEFTARMPVPAYWDDHIEPLKAQPFWSQARFNEEYRPIDFSKPPVLKEDLDSSVNSSLPFLVGVGWYRKVFHAPAEWQERRVTLHVGGVVLEAWAWLNRHPVGYHLGHSTPFEFRLDEHIQPGADNELILAVANTRRDRMGCVLRGFKGFSAGVYRPVHLRVTGACRIADCYVRPTERSQTLLWNVVLDPDPRGRNLQLTWKLRDPETDAVLGQGTQSANCEHLEWATDTFGMTEWSDRDPKLYRIELALSDGDSVMDIRRRTFGLRRLECDGTGLRLNGRPVLLRGATEHGYFAQTCTPPADVEAYRDMIRKQRRLGFNWLRFHTWAPSEEYMQATDELGMMVQVEPPLGFEEPEWRDILRTCRRHPSVVIYCCGNEELLTEEKIAYLRRMRDICKAEVPEVLFSPQEALRGIEYGWHDSDLGQDVIEAPFRHNPRRLALLKEFSDVFGQYCWGMVSYKTLEGDWREIERRQTVYERPCLSHEVGIMGTYIDLDLEQCYAGTRIGTSLYASVRRALAAAGLEDRSAVYYRNSCAWMRLMVKRAIENVRKSRHVAGYDFLGATDSHNHRSGYHCGIMNEFYELKPAFSSDDVLQYNGESVLLLDCTNRRNLVSGKDFGLEVFASLYGAGPLKEGRLSWRLQDDGGNIVLDGGHAVRNVPNGAVTTLGRIAFRVPQLNRPAKVMLALRLSGGEYEIGNEWPYWIFPEASPPDMEAAAGEGLRIISALDEDSLSFLRDGGRVVLLGDAPFPTLPLEFQVALAGRVVGNLATVITDHPVMDAFPHEGYCSWPFYPLFSGAKSVLFEDSAVPFAPIIEVVSTYKYVRKQSCLFELGVGDGRLLVCTLNFDLSDPAAAFLLARILAYASGKDFQPCASVAPEQVAQLIRQWTKASRGKAPATDQAFDPNAQLGGSTS